MKQVLALLLQGLSNKEIGARLGISRHTARRHVSNVLEKYGVRYRTDLLAQLLKDAARDT
ncbi:MAG: helix-turn-helix transcriptional regulator [Chloroflexi bacterium]|nr:helix-turn-helix transcriptional regulator [Chloroflexota bacterium]